MAEPVLPWRLRPPRRVATATFLSPAVRRLAQERGVDAAGIIGTGRDGRVTVADVTRAHSAEASGHRDRVHDEIVPLNAVQRRAGALLLRSTQVAAHAFVAMEIDLDEVDAVRRASRLSFLPFVARAVVEAVRAFPWVNATVNDGEVRAHAAVNVGIAVDLGHQGLIVPIVRGAQAKDLLTIASDIADVARRARDRALIPDDVVGGTFTITNPGPAGTAVSVPIINQPQVAILSTDGVARRAVVIEATDGRDTIGTRATGVLGLSWDHRVFDVAYAAGFLAAVRGVLQDHDWRTEVG
ncbi:MAG: 2-oxo acid dehydrogenase subunit E2 [Actinobacteria bacterium]|nr:2-oxo acid dehydrogenase subunit E2 [Actinomycetota bacterium]